MEHRAARVTEVCILDPGSGALRRVEGSRVGVVAPGEAVLAVTAQQGDGEVTRMLTAPPATIRHAAAALARHYGLHSAGSDRWSGRPATSDVGEPGVSRA